MTWTLNQERTNNRYLKNHTAHSKETCSLSLLIRGRILTTEQKPFQTDVQENLSHVDIFTFTSLNASKQSIKQNFPVPHPTIRTTTTPSSPSRTSLPSSSNPSPRNSFKYQQQPNTNKNRVYISIYLSLCSLPIPILRPTFINPLFYFSSSLKKSKSHLFTICPPRCTG